MVWCAQLFSQVSGVPCLSAQAKQTTPAWRNTFTCTRYASTQFNCSSSTHHPQQPLHALLRAFLSTAVSSACCIAFWGILFTMRVCGAAGITTIVTLTSGASPQGTLSNARLYAHSTRALCWISPLPPHTHTWRSRPALRPHHRHCACSGPAGQGLLAGRRGQQRLQWLCWGRALLPPSPGRCHPAPGCASAYAYAQAGTRQQQQRGDSSSGVQASGAQLAAYSTGCAWAAATHDVSGGGGELHWLPLLLWLHDALGLPVRRACDVLVVAHPCLLFCCPWLLWFGQRGGERGTVVFLRGFFCFVAWAPFTHAVLRTRERGLRTSATKVQRNHHICAIRFRNSLCFHPSTAAVQPAQPVRPAQPRGSPVSMSQQQFPTVDSSQLKLDYPAGPSVWEAAAQHQDSIPASEWEYMMRKNLRDAAFSTLSYLPACTHMPVCAAGNCSAPTFVWVSGGEVGQKAGCRDQRAGCRAAELLACCARSRVGLDLQSCAL